MKPARLDLAAIGGKLRVKNFNNLRSEAREMARGCAASVPACPRWLGIVAASSAAWRYAACQQGIDTAGQGGCAGRSSGVRYHRGRARRGAQQVQAEFERQARPSGRSLTSSGAAGPLSGRAAI